MSVHFRKSNWLDTLYQRWLRVAPGVSNINNKRNITIMKDGLKKCRLEHFQQVTLQVFKQDIHDQFL